MDQIIVNFRHHELPAEAVQIIIECKLGIKTEISRQGTVIRQMSAFFWVWYPQLRDSNTTGKYIALGETSQEHLEKMILLTEPEIDAIKHVGFDVNCAESS